MVSENTQPGEVRERVHVNVRVWEERHTEVLSTRTFAVLGAFP